MGYKKAKASKEAKQHFLLQFDNKNGTLTLLN